MGSRVAVVVVLLLPAALAWDTQQLDLFDLVEEVQATHHKTFYEFLGMQPADSTAEVRRAYKRLALQLHPDKNDAEDADIQFRQLAAVYEVLKDKELREQYDRVLVEGLPSWKSTAFYFRRMRKIGLGEGLLYLLIIVTGIQYCVNWAAYLERKFTVAENVTSVVRRKQRKLKKAGGKNEDELVEEMVEEEMSLVGPPPTWLDTLPCQLWRAVVAVVLAVPQVPGWVREHWREQARLGEVRAREQEEWEEEKRAREEEKVKKKEAKAKRKHVSQYREAVEGDEGATGRAEVVKGFVLPRNSGQMWTDPDLVELSRLIKRIPGGSTDRWDRIADSMERTAAEVTAMAGRIKANPGIVPKLQGVTGKEEARLIGDECLEVEIASDRSEDGDTEEEDGYVVCGTVSEEYVMPEEKKKKKTKGGKTGGAAEEEEEGREEVWSQGQQRSLEAALSLFPKGSAERWDRIAAKVEGRSKEQCVARFKQLAEAVKRKKAEKSD